MSYESRELSDKEKLDNLNAKTISEIKVLTDMKQVELVRAGYHDDTQVLNSIRKIIKKYRDDVAEIAGD